MVGISKYLLDEGKEFSMHRSKLCKELLQALAQDMEDISRYVYEIHATEYVGP